MRIKIVEIAVDADIQSCETSNQITFETKAGVIVMEVADELEPTLELLSDLTNCGRLAAGLI